MMSQTQTDEKEEQKEELSDTNNKRNKPQIVESGTTSYPPKITHLKSSISNSASTLLSANYNPNHNPKKDELVQTASIRILEVESLLDKLNNHIDKHHRKSSKKLQDFEQIHSELAKIQSNLIYDDNDNNNHKNKRSKIDPFIIIACNSNDDDNENEEEKDDEKTCNNNTRKTKTKTKTETVHNDKLAQLEPFQSLVSKIQKEIDPNITSSSDSEIDNNPNPTSPQTKTRRTSKHNRSRNSIKMKKSELHSISDYVNEHRNKMKEKTYQYEQKKEQLKLAKQRLNKAKARFKKRLKKSKQRNRNRAYSDKSKQRKGINIHSMTTSDISTTNHIQSLSPRSKFHTINENSDVDIDNQTVSLSQANLSKFNLSDNRSTSDKQQKNNKSAPTLNIHLNQSSTPSTPYNPAIYGHDKSPTNTSVQSAFSVISDQSFVDDFHSITAELENIDDIVRNQVKSPSMTSIFSDIVNSPKTSPNDQNNNNNNNNNKKTQFIFNNNKENINDTEDHIKSNISSMSESESKDNKNMPSYCSSIETSEANSLQSELFQLQDIENQINDL